MIKIKKPIVMAKLLNNFIAYHQMDTNHQFICSDFNLIEEFAIQGHRWKTYFCYPNDITSIYQIIEYQGDGSVQKENQTLYYPHHKKIVSNNYPSLRQYDYILYYDQQRKLFKKESYCPHKHHLQSATYYNEQEKPVKMIHFNPDSSLAYDTVLDKEERIIHKNIYNTAGKIETTYKFNDLD